MSPLINGIKWGSGWKVTIIIFGLLESDTLILLASPSELVVSPSLLVASLS